MGLLKSPLLKNLAYVNGNWVEAKSLKSFNVFNPANDEVLGPVPDMNVEDVEIAISSAYESFKSWSKTTAKERCSFLKKWHTVLEDNIQELAKIITAETGKTIKESLGEISYGNSFVDWFAEEAKRVNGEVVPSSVRNREIVFIKQPIGVVSLITPWNFPHAMITRKVAAALAAGCTCVVKPAEDTPFTALALAHLAQIADLPKGVLNVVTCTRNNAAPIGKVMCQSPQIAGLSFTGSTEVGKLLYSQCAYGIKKLGLELGGNAPFIVFNSASIDKAVDCAVAAKFRNCGQACVSPNRFFIQAGIFNQFVDKLVHKIQNEIRVGDGFDPNITVGPLINTAQVEKVTRIVNDAINKGATVLCGGKRALSIGDKFFEPTVLSNINFEMACTKEEIFGPVVVCIKFDTEQEAVDLGNQTSRGLAGYFFTNDLCQAWRVARAMEVGMVGINEALISSAEIAFGGIKESGIGREGSHYGIEEFTYVKYLCFGN
uniref:Aldehyde dehydrogenase domain-containing protein n=1 Tax=Clastoptera arizonana TaxID=38151 RepID=A0A1B6DF16_9HEMI